MCHIFRINVMVNYLKVACFARSKIKDGKVSVCYPTWDLAVGSIVR